MNDEIWSFFSIMLIPSVAMPVDQRSLEAAVPHDGNRRTLLARKG
jgi:hypothetical protein